MRAESQATPARADASSGRERWLLLSAGAVWLSSALVFQWRPLMPIDETRYVSVAWEMWSSGQWWVAHMNGMPYADKPPLLFWLINLGWAVFGVNDEWPRLIMPLASLIGLVQLHRIARALGFDRTTAALALLVLMSMLMWWVYSGTVMFDVLLTTCLLGAIAGLVVPLSPRRRLLGMTLWLSLGLLTKGPAVLLSWVPVVAALPLWQERSRRQRGDLMRAWLATAIALMVLLGWALSSARVGGSAYADNLLWHQSIDRLEQVADHARPVWWYLPVLPVLLLPWSVWLPALPFWRCARLAASAPSSARRLLWLWALAPLVLFSLISGKQVHYLMPILPPLALLMADTLARRPDGLTLRGPAALLLLVGAFCLGLGFFRHDQTTLMYAPTGALLLIALALVPALMRTSPARGAIALSLVMAAAMGAVIIVVLAPFWPRVDTRAPAALLSRIEQQGHPILWYGTNYQASFQFAGRLTRPLAMRDSNPAALYFWRLRHPDGWVIGDRRQLSWVPCAPCHVFPWRARELLILPVSVLENATPFIPVQDSR